VNCLAVVKATEADVKLLARLLRAEAEGEGKLGMLMVGNVGVNRARVRCSDFEDINTIREMVFQSPGGFEATQKGYFYQRARPTEIKLARKVIQGKRYHPASYSLWFFEPSGSCPSQWFGQWNVGRYKAHCFYKPTESECAEVYSTY
jgi:N-acetylmuramoyl-L-alanine amidase